MNDAIQGGAALAGEIAAWGLTDDELDVLLWEGTAFPVASADHIAGQLAELRRLSGGNFHGAMALVDLTHRVCERLYLRPAALTPAAPPEPASVPPDGRAQTSEEA